MTAFTRHFIYGLCFTLAWPMPALAQPKVNKGRLLGGVELNRTDLSVSSGGSSNVTPESSTVDDLLRRLRAEGKSKDGSGSGAGAGFGNPTFGGGAGGAGSGANPASAAGNSDDKNTSDRGGKPPGGGGTTGDGSKPQVFDKFWPMCILFDPAVSDAQANEIVKGMHEKGAACQVNLYIEAITVTSVGTDDPGTFNPKSQSTCNMGAIGMPTASVMLANPAPLAAAKMCEAKIGDQYDPGVAGCAQLRGGGMDERQLAQAGSGSFSKGGSDGIIPSVIVPSGWNSGVGMHEAIGHSQMGWPNHEPPNTIDAGLGIGQPKAAGAFFKFWKDTFFALLPTELKPEVAAGPEGTGDLGQGFNANGCQQMRSRAFANTKKIAFDPKQEFYFKQFEKPWPFGKPLWGPQGPPSGDGGQPPIVQNERPKPPKEELVMDDSAKKGGDTPAPPPASIDGRHKKKPGEVLAELIQTSLRKNGKRSGAASSQLADKPVDLPPEKGGGASTESLTFDDTVKKGNTGEADSSTRTNAVVSSSSSSTSMGGSSGGGGESIVFDDSIAKGAGGQTSGPTRGPASSAGITGSSPVAGAVGGGLSSSLDSDFFKALVKADTIKRRRTKGETLRANQKDLGAVTSTSKKTASPTRSRGAGLRQ